MAQNFAGVVKSRGATMTEIQFICNGIVVKSLAFNIERCFIKAKAVELKIFQSGKKMVGIQFMDSYSCYTFHRAICFEQKNHFTLYLNNKSIVEQYQ